MVRIGNVELGEFPLLLAPMEDVSDPPFRALCKEQGCDMMYTEFISVEGLIRDASKSVQKLNDQGIIMVLWTTDAMINYYPLIKSAPFYDHIFCQGTEAVKIFDQASIHGSQWLPAACDPMVHMPTDLSKKDKMNKIW